MATATPNVNTLDSAQRDWLKKMAAALDAKVADATAESTGVASASDAKQQTPTKDSAAAGPTSSPSVSLATLEVRVSYQGTAVPGAKVRLSTGPTQQPDATTDSAGVAIFREIEPGEYHVNAAKRAFVFQPAHVPAGRLALGATTTVNITKAAQGQPPAPSYLYTGGGSTAPTSPPPPGKPVPPPVPGGTIPGPGGTPPVHPGGPPTHPTEPPTSPPAPGESPQVGLATVQVHVHDKEGAPVDKAMVRISTGPASPPDGQTNSAGIATFQLVPGEYHVNAAKRDIVWQPAHIKPGALQPGATYPVTLNKPHEPQPDGDTSSLAVHVTWGRGEGVDAARVDIDGNPKYSAPTDAKGFARFDKLPVGPHSIQATHVSLEYGTVSRSATAIVTKDKQVTKTIALSKSQNLYNIMVQVCWKSDKLYDWVEGAIVTLTPASAPPAVTKKGGYAYFSNLLAGTYTVSALISQTAQTITANNVVLNEHTKAGCASVVMYADPEADPTKPNANAKGNLWVEVKWEGSNLDAVGAVVALSPAAVGPQVVDSSGKALFVDVPAGEYKVSATFTEENGMTSSAIASVTVDANIDNETGLFLASSAESGNLLVTVCDKSGKGLQGVMVSLNDYAGSDFTDTSGLAKFHELPVGKYVVTAHADTAKVDSPDVVGHAQVEAARTAEIQITMAATDAPRQQGNIYVTVSTPDNKDVDFAVVSLYPTVHAPQLAGGGRVEFLNVPVGKYTVEATLESMVARQQVTLKSYTSDRGGSASAHLVLS